MPYTFIPKEPHAKVYSVNSRISTKHAKIICDVIKKKPLKRARRLLDDLEAEKRSLDGKYYTKAVKEFKNLMQSCEKNSEFLGLDADKLFVHASAHQGSMMRRRRRKAAFGSKLKATNIEFMLIERGKGSVKKEKAGKDKKTHAAEAPKEVKHAAKTDNVKEVSGP